MDLSNDDEHQNESVRFVLPTWVGHRYGVPETSRLHTLQGTAHNAGLNIMLDVQMSGEIFDITSNYLLQDLPPPAQMNGLHLARKQFQRPQQAHLHEAFMVVVQANGLDEQRCFLEEWNGWAALSLNLVPRFESLRVSRPSEYIFLIDHSGSMSIDNKMKEARETLKILLHALPETAWFNVYKFDHTYESLWHRSCQVSSFFREAAVCSLFLSANSVILTVKSFVSRRTSQQTAGLSFYLLLLRFWVTGRITYRQIFSS